MNDILFCGYKKMKGALLMYKKIIAVIAVLSLAIWVLPYTKTAAASEFIIKNDGSGKSYLSGYNGKGGTVTIPKNVSYIGSGAFENDVSVKKVTIPASCKSIDDKAFSGCVNLKTVIFEGNVKIGDSAFLNCVSLENVLFQNNSSNVEIGESSFANCFALTSINLPENTSLISKFAFGNCISLETITLPKNTVVSDKSIGYMYDEKNDMYFLADGETEAYVSCYELYNGKAMEWYAPKTGKAVSVNVVKGSDGERYAKSCKIPYAKYVSLTAPKVTAEPDVEKIILKWNKIKGAEAYRVYISDGGNYREYKTTAATMCTVSGLEGGKSYEFKVAAMVFLNGKIYSEVACSEKVSAVPNGKKVYNKKSVVPSAPKVTAKANSDSVELEWKRVNNADAYRVYIFDGSKNEYVQYKVVTGRSCTVTGLNGGAEYKFKVVSLYSPTGRKNKYIEGEASGEIVVSTSKIVISG